MQNIAQVEASKIDKTASLTKVIVGRKGPDISIKKVWVIQQANIIHIAIDMRRPIIFWNVKKVQLLRGGK